MWTIPPEYSPHRHTWMAFPYDSRIWGRDLDGAQETVSELVRAISCYERVRLLVPPNDEKRPSTRFRSSAIDVIAASYNDILVRDTLPTFAVGSDNSLVAIDWHFNGWGKTPYLDYTLDQRIFMLRAKVNQMNVEPVDLGDEVRHGIDLCLAFAPIVRVRPVLRKLLHRRQLHALRCIGDLFALGPLCRGDAFAQVGEVGFRGTASREIEVLMLSISGFPSITTLNVRFGSLADISAC